MRSFCRQFGGAAAGFSRGVLIGTQSRTARLAGSCCLRHERQAAWKIIDDGESPYQKESYCHLPHQPAAKIPFLSYNSQLFEKVWCFLHQSLQKAHW